MPRDVVCLSGFAELEKLEVSERVSGEEATSGGEARRELGDAEVVGRAVVVLRLYTLVGIEICLAIKGGEGLLKVARFAYRLEWTRRRRRRVR